MHRENKKSRLEQGIHAPYETPCTHPAITKWSPCDRQLPIAERSPTGATNSRNKSVAIFTGSCGWPKGSSPPIKTTDQR